MITLDLSPEIESRIARIAENWGRDPRGGRGTRT